jgi:hypothetical protein
VGGGGQQVVGASAAGSSAPATVQRGRGGGDGIGTFRSPSGVGSEAQTG